MTDNRVSRGRKTQVLVAEYWRNAGVFPDAQSIAASLPGEDILNTPGWSVEVKARRAFTPVEWVKQAAKNAGTKTPVVVMRPDGLGEASVGQFLAFMTLKDFTELLNYIQEIELDNERYESGNHN